MKRFLLATLLLAASAATYAATADGTMAPKDSFTFDLHEMKQDSTLTCKFESTENAWFLYSRTTLQIETLMKIDGKEKYIIEPLTMFGSSTRETKVGKLPPKTSFQEMTVTNLSETIAINYSCTLTPGSTDKES